jgi:undecaprenyl diphosphate synthase
MKGVALKKDELSEQEIMKSLLPERIPLHVAIIMDGNRRWAKQRSLPILMGHQAGVKTLRMVVEMCLSLKIKILTVYAFSRENWRRSKEEVGILLRLFEFYSKNERKLLYKNGVQFRIIGFLDDLPQTLVKEFRKTEEYTRENDRLQLNLAVNYSSRSEILNACRLLAQEVKEGIRRVDEIDEKVFSSFLLTGEQPDPDLLIRTSGEMRISNFLLWQSAYTELWFTDSYWPGFSTREFLMSILDYQSRERRFGGS